MTGGFIRMHPHRNRDLGIGINHPPHFGVFFQIYRDAQHVADTLLRGIGYAAPKIILVGREIQPIKMAMGVNQGDAF
jgi:hypothetical protein